MPGQMRNEFKPSLQIGWIVKILFKERGAKVTVNASTSVSTLSATSPQHAPAPQPTSTAAADQVVLERHATTVKCVNIFGPLATSLQISKKFWLFVNHSDYKKRRKKSESNILHERDGRIF
jgi:hypothetical protein